ncbi:MAG: hypothetical protein DRN04_06015 [Thermoprotei archaeon]|nr:MAG: hypothetical protein DRN04_06015 [Thermoprotei archaeon]
MSEKWAILAPFILGLILGKKSQVVEAEVPPRIVYFPLEEKSDTFSEISLDEIKNLLKDIASKSGLKLNENDLEILANKTKYYLDLYREKAYCLKMIRDLSKAFMERRISSSLYTSLVRIYKQRLIEIELKLSKIS